MKKSLLFLFAMLISTTIIGADFENNGYYFNFTGEGTVEITSGTNKYTGDISIPDYVNYNMKYYSITSIGYEAFKDCDELTSVAIGKYITHIDTYAFKSCDALTTITISSNLQSAGSYIFTQCPSLSVINIVSNSIAEACGKLTNGLLGYAHILRRIIVDGYEVTSLNIPNNISSIVNHAFQNCDNLTEILIANNVTEIGNYAFCDCDGLTDITIPDNVIYISDYAFQDCDSVTAVKIGDGVTDIGQYAFNHCDNLASVKIGESINNIGNYAFESCSNLSNFTVGCSLNSVGIKVFEYSPINTLTITANSIESYCNSIANTVIRNCNYYSATTIRTVPRKIQIAGKELKALVVPNNIDTISTYLFYNCDGLTDITIPDNVIYISDYAFQDCDSVTAVKIGDGVTDIEREAFISCDNLTSIEIGQSISSIGDYAFQSCPKLSNFTVGCHLKNIGMAVFDKSPITMVTLTAKDIATYCKSSANNNIKNCRWQNGPSIRYAPRTIRINGKELSSLTIPNAIDTITTNLFYNCDGLIDITIPDNVIYISDYAFQDCDSVTAVKIGDGVTDIEQEAFISCDNLTSIEIGQSISSIGDYAFQSCPKLSNFTVGCHLKNIGMAVFDKSPITMVTLTAKDIATYCKSSANNNIKNCRWQNGPSIRYAPRTIRINGKELTSLTIPNTIDTITTNLFYNCNSLTEVIISDKIKNVADYAFNNCSNLKELTCNAITPPALGNNAFSTNVLSSVYIPCGTSDAYKASSWNSYCKNFVEPASEMTFIVQTADSIQGSVIVDQMPTCNNDTAIFHAEPNPLYEFIGWSDGNTDNPRTLVLTQDTSLVAYFEIIYLQPDTVTLCYGETYQWHDKTYDASGVYIDTLSSGVATLHLTILPQVEETIEEATICSGETYTWQADGKEYAESGTYSVTLQDINGCDSVVILHLTFNPIATTEEHVTACDSYTWNGETYTESGDYTYTTVAANGCDSIVTLHLTINNSEIGETEYVTICYGETYTWNGQTYSTEGEYSITLSNTLGCDSVATLQLTIMPEAVTTTETVVIGSDELPYTWRGNTYSATGRYTVIEQYTTVACDSAIHVLNLTVLTTGNHDEQSVTICETEAPYTWYGESYSATGKYTYTEKYAGTDIDSIQHILNLTVNPTVYTEEHITACDSYTWNDETYTQSGEYVYTTVAANGCDSIVTLHLTINKSEYVEFSMTACDSYEWHGMTYTISGDYTYTTTTDQGCERVEVLHLTINKSEYVEESVTACDSYEWNGIVYTESGDYIYTTTTDQGCERVEVLHLTINKSEYVEESVTACDSYEWNGIVYTESGDYTYNTTTEQGCERVEVLHLTILPDATTESEELALCPSELPYEWYGQWLTEAGSYTATEQYAGMDCDSIIHELTVNVYVQTLPAAVSLPIVRTGEAIDVSIPTAEIQAHIAAETWYAPNAEVAWYIMENSDWAALTAEPVKAGTTQIVLKYAVATDCGSVESDNIVIDVIPTSVENTHSESRTSDCQKILYEDHIYILRDGKVYSIMGQEM